MTPDDFIDMRWRIDLLSETENCLTAFPDLGERMDGLLLNDLKVLTSITNDQLVRYIVYAYHRFSPFVRKITDVKHRKNQALIQAGFSFGKDGVPEDIQELISTTNERVADITLRFLQGENSMKFSALMMQVDAYYKYNYELAYTDAKQISQLTKAIHALEDSIESLSQEVFFGDTDLNNFVAGSKLRGLILTPEQFAQKNKRS